MSKLDQAKKVSVYNLEQRMKLKMRDYQMVVIFPPNTSVAVQDLRSFNNIIYCGAEEFKSKSFVKHLKGNAQALAIHYCCYTFNYPAIHKLLMSMISLISPERKTRRSSYSNHYTNPGPWASWDEQWGATAQGESMSEEDFNALFNNVFRGGR